MLRIFLVCLLKLWLVPETVGFATPLFVLFFFVIRKSASLITTRKSKSAKKGKVTAALHRY